MLVRFAEKMDRFGRELSVNKQTDQSGYLLVSQDFDTLTGRQNLWLSVSMLRQWAARIPQLELAPQDELDSAREANSQLTAALAQEKARADEAEGKLARITGLSKDGYKVTRLQGRPPRQKVSG